MIKEIRKENRGSEAGKEKILKKDTRLILES
jgi:hypothetical protein